MTDKEREMFQLVLDALVYLTEGGIDASSNADWKVSQAQKLLDEAEASDAL